MRTLTSCMPINSVGLCLIIRKICLHAREHQTVVAHVGAVEAIETVKLIPRQLGELRSELDVGPGVSCADREGVGD